MSDKSVLQECPTRMTYKSVAQECPTRVSRKSPTRVLHKSVPHCPTRVSDKSLLQVCPTRVSDKSVRPHVLRSECASFDSSPMPTCPQVMRRFAEDLSRTNTKQLQDATGLGPGPEDDICPQFEYSRWVSTCPRFHPVLLPQLPCHPWNLSSRDPSCFSLLAAVL